MWERHPLFLLLCCRCCCCQLVASLFLSSCGISQKAMHDRVLILCLCRRAALTTEFPFRSLHLMPYRACMCQLDLPSCSSPPSCHHPMANFLQQFLHPSLLKFACFPMFYFCRWWFSNYLEATTGFKGSQELTLIKFTWDRLREN